MGTRVPTKHGVPLCRSGSMDTTLARGSLRGTRSVSLSDGTLTAWTRDVFGMTHRFLFSRFMVVHCTKPSAFASNAHRVQEGLRVPSIETSSTPRLPLRSSLCVRRTGRDRAHSTQHR